MTEPTRPGLLAAEPYDVPKRSDRALCGACETSPAGCDTSKWLRGLWCCSSCTGTHEKAASR